jgi:hypothetical protein
MTCGGVTRIRYLLVRQKFAWPLMLLGATTLISGCESRRLDRQMHQLCQIDAGVKVYETVQVSQAEYESMLNYRVKAKSQEEFYGPAYRLVQERRHIVGKDDDSTSGRGQLIRNYSAIYRNSDSKLLGENVWYSRVGGYIFTFGFEPAKNACPKPSGNLFQSIFMEDE